MHHVDPDEDPNNPKYASAVGFHLSQLNPSPKNEENPSRKRPRENPKFDAFELSDHEPSDSEANLCGPGTDDEYPLFKPPKKPEMGPPTEKPNPLTSPTPPKGRKSNRGPLKWRTPPLDKTGFTSSSHFIEGDDSDNSFKCGQLRYSGPFGVALPKDPINNSEEPLDPLAENNSPSRSPTPLITIPQKMEQCDSCKCERVPSDPIPDGRSWTCRECIEAPKFCQWCKHEKRPFRSKPYNVPWTCHECLWDTNRGRAGIGAGAGAGY